MTANVRGMLLVLVIFALTTAIVGYAASRAGSAGVPVQAMPSQSAAAVTVAALVQPDPKASQFITLESEIPNAHMFDDTKDMGELPLNTARPSTRRLIRIDAPGYVGLALSLGPNSPSRVRVTLMPSAMLPAEPASSPSHPIRPVRPMQPPVAGRPGTPPAEAPSLRTKVITETIQAPDVPWNHRP